LFLRLEPAVSEVEGLGTHEPQSNQTIIPSNPARSGVESQPERSRVPPVSILRPGRHRNPLCRSFRHGGAQSWVEVQQGNTTARCHELTSPKIDRNSFAVCNLQITSLE
jgi:hypothetical protein